MLSVVGSVSRGLARLRRCSLIVGRPGSHCVVIGGAGPVLLPVPGRVDEVLVSYRAGAEAVVLHLHLQRERDGLPGDDPLARAEALEDVGILLGQVFHHGPHEGLVPRVHQAEHQEAVALGQRGLVETGGPLRDDD